MAYSIFTPIFDMFVELIILVAEFIVFNKEYRGKRVTVLEISEAFNELSKVEELFKVFEERFLNSISQMINYVVPLCICYICALIIFLDFPL